MRPTVGTRRASRALAAAIWVVSSSPQAAAQSARPATQSPPAEARTHFERGVTLYDEADFAAALVEFKRAYALAPTWQVLFNIGQAYFQVRDYADALASLRQFVAEGRDQIPEDRRTLVRGELAELADRVGYVTVASNLIGAAVSIDDRAAGPTPLPEPALVSVGIRKITASYPGRPPVEREVAVPAGETVNVELDFAVPAAASAQGPNDEAPDRTPAGQVTPPTGSRNRAPAIVSFGVATAGAAVGAIFGSLALRDKSRLDGECLAKACAVGSQSDINAVSRDATISTVGFGVMAVGVVVGLGLWLTAKNSPAQVQGTTLVDPSRSPVSTLSFRLVPGYLAGSF